MCGSAHVMQSISLYCTGVLYFVSAFDISSGDQLNLNVKRYRRQNEG